MLIVICEKSMVACDPSLYVRFVILMTDTWRVKHCIIIIIIRDVKTVYFSETVTGLPKPVFYQLPKGLL